MKPNPDYLKKLLTAFQNSPEPTTDIRELAQHGLSYEDPQFYFHLRLLNDGGFVVREDDHAGIGCDRLLDGDYHWSVLPLRLTASGHEFAEALNNGKALQAVKKSLINSSISVMRDIAVAVLKSEAMHHFPGLQQ